MELFTITTIVALFLNNNLKDRVFFSLKIVRFSSSVPIGRYEQFTFYRIHNHK